jgi:glutamate N-acetyltransferase/amino-acid N-acetyltransferase
MIKNLKISTANCGIKYKNRDDLLLIAFDLPANVAGVFTQSSMPAAPVVWCKKNINGGVAKALLVNAGNANAFTGKVGEETVLKTANKTAEILNCNVQEVFISSTGVIGETLNAELITSAIPQMLQNFDDSKKAWDKASRAIMTTDTRPKLIKKSCKIGEQKIELVGFAKGSGMIAPNMATMLGYIFTDADISSEILQILLSEITQKTFNSITVDSDQSTNDSLFLFATKAAQNDKILSADDEKLIDFKNTLHQLALGLAKMIVIDGEGAKKLIEIEITGASSQIQAKEVAFAVANAFCFFVNLGSTVKYLNRSSSIFYKCL